VGEACQHSPCSAKEAEAAKEEAKDSPKALPPQKSEMIQTGGRGGENCGCSVAHHDFDAGDMTRSGGDNELSLTKGDHVRVKLRDDSEWWYGEHSDGSGGYFPSSFVAVATAVEHRHCPFGIEVSDSDGEEGSHLGSSSELDDSAATTVLGETVNGGVPPEELSAVFQALYDFDEANANVEAISFSTGDCIFLLRRNDNGWSIGVNAATGMLGYFPMAFAKRVELQKGDEDTDLPEQLAPSARCGVRCGQSAVALLDVTGNDAERHVSLQRGDFVTILKVEKRRSEFFLWKVEVQCNGSRGWVCPGCCGVLPDSLVKSARKR
jgi:Variant SH3 domain/SH3 domain